MALTPSIRQQPSPIYKDCMHAYASNNAEATLITGLAGKRIRIWRFHIFCGTASKFGYVYSATSDFGAFPSGVLHILHSTDGIPVFTCNVGEDFKIAPGDQTDWVTYVVYSIE